MEFDGVSASTAHFIRSDAPSIYCKLKDMPSFGQIHENLTVADIHVRYADPFIDYSSLLNSLDSHLSFIPHRSQFCPVSRIDGSNTAPLYLCSSEQSGRKRRKFADEKRGSPRKTAVLPGGRAAMFFNDSVACHGCIQIQCVKGSELLANGKRKLTSWAKQAALLYPSMKDSIDVLPKNVSEHEKLFATTLCVPHTCARAMPQIERDDAEGKHPPLPHMTHCLYTTYSHVLTIRLHVFTCTFYRT